MARPGLLCKIEGMGKGDTVPIGGLGFEVPVPPGRESRHFAIGAEVELDLERIALFASLYGPQQVGMLRSLAGQTGSVMAHDRLTGWPETCRVAFVNGPHLMVPHDLLKAAHA
jgi:hypothetical protein